MVQKENPVITSCYDRVYGGRTGIRTLDTCKGILVFKTSAFNRSAILPRMILG